MQAKQTYTVNLTANEVSTLLELVKAEQQHYEDSEDTTDVAVYTLCDNILNKLYNA